MKTKPGKVLVVTSGKGGVGKTTTSAAIGAGLAKIGYRVVVVDFDIGLRNLDIVMGCEGRVIFDMINLLAGDCTLNQALVQDSRLENLYILPASQTKNKQSLDLRKLKVLIARLKNEFDYIICDSPAGIEHGTLAAALYADEAIVVVNPNKSSINDADRVLGMLMNFHREFWQSSRPALKEHLLINRYSKSLAKRGVILNINDIQELLGISIVGVIPDDVSVLQAANKGIPVTLDSCSEAASFYSDTVLRLLGQNILLEPEHWSIKLYRSFCEKLGLVSNDQTLLEHHR